MAAWQQYQEALESDPQNVAALEALESALSEAGEWQRLAEVVPRFAMGLQDTREKARFLLRAGHVARHQAGDEPMAGALLNASIQLVSSGELAAEDLVGVLRAVFAPEQKWVEMIAALTEITAVSEDKELGARALYAAGRTYEDRLYDRERALSCYNKAFKIFPGFVEPLHAARALFAQEEKWKMVSKLYELELKVVREPRARARLFKEHGQLLWDRMREREPAVAAFREARELDPDLVALDAVIAELEADGAQGAQGVVITETLETDAVAAPAPEAAVETTPEPVEVEATAADEAEDVQPADEAAAEEAADDETASAPVDAEEPAAVEAAAVEPSAVADEAASDADAADDVAAALSAEGDEGAAEPVASAEPSIAEAPSVSAPAPAPAPARPAPAPRAAAPAPAGPVAAGAIRAAGERTVLTRGEGSSDERLRGYGDRLAAEARGASGAHADDLWSRAISAAVLSDRSDAEVVEWALEAIQASSSRLTTVRSLLASLYGYAALWEALRDRLVELDEVDPDGGWADALYGVCFYGLGAIEPAVAFGTRAGGDAALELSVLEVASKGNWRKAQQSLTDAFASYGGAAETESYRVQAWIALGLGNEDKAADCLRRVLRADKADLGALALSEAVLRATEKWPMLADALKNAAAALDDSDPYRKVLIYREMAHLYGEKLNQELMVLSTWQSWLEVEPDNVELMDQLVERLTALNRFPDLIEVLKRKADAVTDAEEQMEVLGEVARLYVEKFNNQAEAISAYERILAIDPARRDALVALEDAYEKRREWDRLIETKKQLVELVDSDEERAALLRSAADVAATRKRDMDLAVELWRAVLDWFPGDAETLTSLEQVYERGKQYEELTEVLERRLTGLTDTKERAAVLLKLGMYLGDKLGRTADALPWYEELLAIETDNFRAREALKKGYVELQRWDDLREFFARDGQWAEYVRQLESVAKGAQEEDLRLDLLFRAADVLESELGDEPRAMKNLEQVLQADPENERAARRLAAFYEERGDFRKLPDVLEVVLAQTTEPAARYAIEVKLARIAVDKRRDPEAALRWFSEAMGEVPESAEIYGEVEDVAGSADAWSEAARMFEDAREALVGSSDHQPAWLNLTLRLGRIYDEALQQPEESLGCYQQALLVEADNEAALNAQDALLTRLERWDELLEVLSSKADLADDASARIALLERICGIHETQRSDAYAAIERHREILAIDAAWRPSLDALRRLHAATGNAIDHADVLRQLLTIDTPDTARASWIEMQLELARLLDGELSEHAAAVDALEAVVTLEPGHADARRHLEGLLENEGERQRVARLLEPLYERDAAWGPLVEVLEIRLEDEGTDDVRVSLLERIGRVHREKLDDAPAAFEAWSRLARIRPDARDARSELEALAEASSDWPSIVDLYESLLEEVAYTNASLAVAYAERAAEFQDRRLGEPGEAIRLHRRILEIEPGREASLLALDALLQRTENWDDLLALCEERLQFVQVPEDRRAIHLQAATLLEDRLGDGAQAIHEYRRVLDLFPSDTRALESLDRLYGATGDPVAQGEIIAARIGLLDPSAADALELKNRLAELQEREVGDAHRAIELWRDVLSVDARNLSALSNLERLLEDGDTASAAAEVLEPLFIAAEQHEKLAELLEIRLRYVEEAVARLSMYRRLGRLREEALADKVGAWDVVLRALAEFLGEEVIVATALRLAKDLDRFEELAQRLEELAPEASDPTVLRGALVRAATIREERLGDLHRAIELWTEVLDLDGYDREALEALDRLDQATERWKELVEIVLRKADLPGVMDNWSERRPLLFRAAALYEEKLGQEDDAIEVLRNVLMADPSDADAIELLERLYTRTERWDDLVENYERKLSITEDAAARRQLWFTLGAVLEGELADPDRATMAYNSVLESFPKDLEALRSLDRLYAQTENWHELLGVLRRQAELVESEDEARNIRARVARLLETELGSPTDALNEYAAILAEDPTHGPSRDALEAMIESGEEAGRAAGVLEGIYRSEEQWDALIRILSVRRDTADMPDERRGIWVEIARIQEEQLGDQVQAWEARASAAREGAVLDDVNELERLAQAVGAWEDTAALFAELWDEAIEAEMRRTIGLRVARIREEELRDLDGAVEAFQRVHDEDPSDIAALQSLERLHEAGGRWEALADVLQKRVLLATSDEERTGFQLRLGAVYAECLEEPVEALSMYREVLAAEPTNDTALAALDAMIAGDMETFEVAQILEPIYRGQQWWDRLLSLNETRIRNEESPDERYRLWLENADVLENLAKPAECMAALGSALVERPSDESLRVRLESIAAAESLWQDAAGIYGRLLREDLGDTEALDTCVRLATILDDRLGDVDAAESAWRRALEIEPSTEAALRALDRILTGQERWEDVVDILARMREVVYDPTESVPLTFRHATLLEEKLGRVDDAIRTHDDVLALDPSHRPSLDALVRLYEQDGQWESLYDTWERVLPVVTDETERTDIQVRLAALATEELDRKDEAIDLWRSVLMARPTDARALESLAWLFGETEQFNELAEILDRQIEQAGDDAKRRDLLHRSASLWADTLDNPDMGIERYNRVLAIADEDAVALAALRSLYERVGDHDRLVATLRRMIELGQIAEEELPSVWRQMAELLTDVLNRPDEAIQAWTELLAVAPGDLDALDRLDLLYTAAERWTECNDVLRQKAEVAENDEDRIELLKRVARTCESQLQNTEAAAEAWEAVIDLDIGDEEGAAALERLFTEMGEFEALAGLHVERIAVIDDEWEQVQTLRKAASLYENQLERPDSAYLIVTKAAMITPLDEEVLGELERLAAAAGVQSQLGEFYQTLIQAVANNPNLGEAASVPLLLAVGRLQEVTLQRPELAEPYFDRVLALDGENEEALAALDRIYTGLEDWEMLVQTLRRRANLAPDTEAEVALYARIGELWEERLQNLDEATEAWKMVVRLDDTDARALSALERIYERTGQWREYIEILTMQADQSYDPVVTTPIRFRIGQTWMMQLENPERAIGAFQDVLSGDPGHVDSMLALESLYATVGKWRDYLDTLEQRRSVTMDVEGQIAIHFLEAEAWERQMDDIDAAVDALNRVLSLEPTNLRAIEELERIFLDNERTIELVETYERHVAALEHDEDAKAGVLVTMARLFAEALEDNHRAIATYQRILAFAPTHLMALEKAGEAYEMAGDAENAITMYERLADATPVTENQVRFLFRAGELREGTMGDVDTAETRYQRVLQLNPEFVPAMQALQRVYMARGEWTQAIDAVQVQFDLTRDPRERANLLVQMGDIAHAHMNNVVAARRHYEDAIELDPRNMYACEPLARMYSEASEWARAQTVLTVLLESDEYMQDQGSMLSVYAQLGRVNEELVRVNDALECYEYVLKLDPSHFEASMGLARLYRRAERYDDAYAITRDILATHGARMSSEDSLQLYLEAGDIKRMQGQGRAALEMYERALQVDPRNNTALRAIVEIAEAGGDTREIVEARQRYLEAVTDPTLRYKLLIDIGDGFAELEDMVDAERSYKAAVEIQPNSREVLHKLLNVYTESGNWRRATEALGLLANTEADGGRKSQYIYAIGAIFRDELADREKALEFFNSALDANPNELRPFQDIDAMLTEAKDWKALERNYRKMIERVAAETTERGIQLKYFLFKNLGEIYRSRTDQPELAIEAYKLASNIKPDDVKLLEILADLYTRSGATGEVVVREHQRLIAVSPFRIESYRALFEAYIEMREFDRAWLMASALSVLQSAEPKEQQFYEKFLPANVQQVRSALTLDQLRLVYHKEIDGHLNAIFGLLATHLKDRVADDLKRWGINRRKDKIDLDEQRPITMMSRYAMQRLQVPEFQLFQRADFQGFANARTSPSALIVGGDMLSGRNERELAFLVARNVMLMRPEFYLASAYMATEHLRVFFYAALAVVTGQMLGDAPAEAVMPLVEELRRLPEPVLVQLRNHVGAFLHEGRNPDISKWLRDADHTANRVGLLLCGDLRQAIACVKNETMPISKATPKDKVSELILFSISDEYAQLRKDLGLALQSR